MQSIALNHPQRLDGPVTTYKYATYVTPADVEEMSREELIQLVYEQATLLSLVMAIVYNTRAGLATRLVELDLLFENVEKNVRHKIGSILEKRPILYSGMVRDSETGKRVSSGRIGIAERLGINGGTVSTAYHTLADNGLIVLHERKAKGSVNRHYDVEMQEAFLLNPAAVQDKKEQRAEPQPKPQQVCPVCGGEHIDFFHSFICYDCHQVSHVEIKPDGERIVSTVKQEEVQSAQPLSENRHDEKRMNADLLTVPSHPVISPASQDDHDAVVPAVSAPVVMTADEAVLQAMETLLKPHGVVYKPYMTCSCGCKLWRNVLGEWECCRCDPAPLWPDRITETLRILYPHSRYEKRERSSHPSVVGANGHHSRIFGGERL